MAQNHFNLCVIGFKLVAKQIIDNKCQIERVHKPNGTTYYRSCKNRTLDEIIKPIAKNFCKKLKKLK